MSGKPRFVQRSYRRLVLTAGLAALVGAGGLAVSHRFRAASEPPSAIPARAAIAAGRYAEASTYLERWIADRPDQAEPYYLAAESAWKQSRLDAVLAHLSRARKLGYSKSRTDRLWGLWLAKTGRIDEAQPLLQATWDESAGRQADAEVAEALAKLVMQRFDLESAREILNR